MSKLMLEEDDVVEAAPAPDDKDLAQVKDLAHRYLALEQECTQIEEQLKRKQLELRQIRESDLPLAMTTIGMTAFSLVGGGLVRVKEAIHAGISQANQPQAFSWLEKNGHGAIIKHEIKILFGKGEDAWAKKFLRDCAARKKLLRTERKDAVHPGTLTAFVKEQIAAAKAEGKSPENVIPYDILGVFTLRYAEVIFP